MSAHREHKTIKLKTGEVLTWKLPLEESKPLVKEVVKEEVKKEEVKKNWTVITYKDLDKEEVDEVFHFNNPKEVMDKFKVSKTSFYKYVKLGKDIPKSYFIQKN